METRIEIANDLDELPRVVAWTDAFLEKLDNGEELGGKLHLVVEELATNVINHGYADGANGLVWLTLRARPGSVVVFVEDEAPAFNPFAHEQAVDTDAALDEREIGGLGIFLVKELVDYLTYTREDGRNRVGAWFGSAPPESESKPSDDPGDKTGKRVRGLSWRFASSFFIIFLVSLTCAAALNFFKFERLFLRTAARQYDSILRDAQSAIEGSLGQGLTLASNFSAQIVIDKTVRQQDGAFHLMIQDTTGKLLFTDKTSAPQASLPKDLAQRIATEEDGFTRFGDEQGLGVAIVIRQGGAAEGALILTHNPQEAQAEVKRLRGVLARVALLVAAIFAPFITLISYAAMVPVDRRHMRLSAMLSQIVSGRRHEDASAVDDYALLDSAHALEVGLRKAETPVIVKGGAE